MEHKRGNEAYVILRRGARSRGYKRRERQREFGLVVRCLSWPPPRLSYSAYLRSSPSPCVCPSLPLRKALDIPFYRYKEMPSCTMGV
jgi:hypothetical protein